MKKQLFLTYWQHLARFQSHLQHTVSFLDKFIKKKWWFSQKFEFFFCIPMIIPMLLPGHNTKKKYWPKSPWLKKHPKMPKNANFAAYFDHFLTNVCHLDGLHSAENLGGIAQSFDMFLFKIWKKITFLTQECAELHVLNISQTPSNASRMSEGWWKPKFCLTFVAKCCISHST